MTEIVPSPEPHDPVRIGLTMDLSFDTSYSRYPWYALRDNYCAALVTNGAVPVPLPYVYEAIDAYLDMVDGLMLTGGDFDHDPQIFGVARHPETNVNERRTKFEMLLLRKALAREMPFFGVCAGQQLLNLIRGGTIFQHIPDDVPGSINHLQSECRHKPQHSIAVSEGSLLAKACKGGATTVMVNTSHHQAVARAGKNLYITARAEDGVVEAIEDPSLPFCIGVQWHPEFFVQEVDLALYRMFVDAAEKYRAQRRHQEQAKG